MFGKIKSKELLNYIYVFLLIGVSTIPIMRNLFVVYFCLFISLLDVRLINKYVNLIYIFLFLIVLEFYHYFYFSPNYDFSVVRMVLISFFIAFVFAIKLNINFIKIYINIIHFLSIISLVIYFAFLLSPNTVNMFVNLFDPLFKIEYVIYNRVFKLVNPFFYNFDGNFYNNRNNGPFWEPTIFATLLILSIIFNLIISKKNLNKYSIVSFFTLFTTFSTTGLFAVFFLVFTLFFFNVKLNYFIKIILLFVFIFSGFYAYNNLFFLQGKVLSEITQIQYSIDEKGGDSRLASAILDWKEVTAKPKYFFFGKGSDKRVRIEGSDKDVLRNNGLTALLVQKGLFFLIIYLYLIYFTFYKLCIIYNKGKILPFIFFMTMIILSNSEILFDLIIFNFITFLGLILHTMENRKVVLKNPNA